MTEEDVGVQNKDEDLSMRLLTCIIKWKKIIKLMFLYYKENRILIIYMKHFRSSILWYLQNVTSPGIEILHPESNHIQISSFYLNLFQVLEYAIMEETLSWKNVF